ncbi:MAG: NUDIX domain-containing protein [Patescibacteria group bacterium]
MELLKEIKDKEYPEDRSTLEPRKAARAILFDENNLIPVLFVSKHNYHKLPGGGIDEGEDQIQALKREAKEEAGCEIEITGEVGKIIEYRSEWNQLQTSYCYLGKVISKGEPDFTEKEIAKGFQLVWLTLDEAIDKIKNDQPAGYEGSFIQKRDIIFLKTAKEIKK